VYAVVKSGGQHHRVEVGDTIQVEKLFADVGEQIELGEVVMVSGEDGVSIGRPLVDGAKVIATVQDHMKGPKIRVFKMKPKKRYRRTQGHRQTYTRLSIDSIETA
jgi:large subunit ribosomal protein L21